MLDEADERAARGLVGKVRHPSNDKSIGNSICKPTVLSSDWTRQTKVDVPHGFGKGQRRNHFLQLHKSVWLDTDRKMATKWLSAVVSINKKVSCGR